MCNGLPSQEPRRPRQRRALVQKRKYRPRVQRAARLPLPSSERRAADLTAVYSGAPYAALQQQRAVNWISAAHNNACLALHALGETELQPLALTAQVGTRTAVHVMFGVPVNGCLHVEFTKLARYLGQMNSELDYADHFHGGRGRHPDRADRIAVLPEPGHRRHIFDQMPSLAVGAGQNS